MPGVYVSTQDELCCPNGYTLESEGNPTMSHNEAFLLGQDSTDHRNPTAGEQKLVEAVITIDPLLRSPFPASATRC